MFKILLVDDDDLVLQGLEKLIRWDLLKLTIAGMAKDGYSALEIIKREKPDILITDICMPSMSGLELAKYAREISPEMMVVFLTGYENFSFVRQAIELRAMDYLLKPVEYAVMQEKLGNLCEILMERQAQDEKERKQSFKENAVRNTVTRWLCGDIDFQTAAGALEESIPNLNTANFRLIVIEAGRDILSKEFLLKQKQLDDRIRSLLLRIKYFARSDYKACHLNLTAGRVAIIVPDFIEKIHEILNIFLNRIMGESGLNCIASMGAAVPFSRLPAAYGSALEALTVKMFSSNARILRYDSPKVQRLKAFKNELDRILENTFICIAGHMKDGIRIWSNELEAFLSRHRDRVELESMSLYIIEKLDEFINTLGEAPIRLPEEDPEYIGGMKAFKKATDISYWTENLFLHASENLMHKRRVRKGDIVKKVEKFVQEHIEQEITLKDVSQHFQLTPNYLGFLFKEESGECFSDFLGKKRMERARELLMDTDLRIYEIAEKLGYRNMTYFHRKFKEAFGIKPGDLRKNKGSLQEKPL